MLKYLDSDTFGIVQDGVLKVKAKIWNYPEVDKDSDFHNVGIVGGFDCLEDTSLEESQLLFSKIEEELKNRGCTKIVGPMNGNTWQDYRLTTNYGKTPRFALEPYTPAYFIKHWLNAGFLPHEKYSSYLTHINDWEDSRVLKLKDKFKHLTLRQLQEEDVEPIFDLSLKSFIKNPYYVGINKDTYLNKYGKMMALLTPNVSWVAYDGDKLVGYGFNIMNNVGVKKANDSIIIKTAAVDHSREYAGLGIYLLWNLMEQGKKLGVDYVIHALMHDSNSVQNIIKSSSQKIRAYTLYKKDI